MDLPRNIFRVFSLSVTQFITWGTLRENWLYPNQVPTIWNVVPSFSYSGAMLWQSCKTVILSFSFLTDDFPCLNKVFTLRYITFLFFVCLFVRSFFLLFVRSLSCFLFLFVRSFVRSNFLFLVRSFNVLFLVFACLFVCFCSFVRSFVLSFVQFLVCSFFRSFNFLFLCFFVFFFVSSLVR